MIEIWKSLRLGKESYKTITDKPDEFPVFKGLDLIKDDSISPRGFEIQGKCGSYEGCLWSKNQADMNDFRFKDSIF